MSKVRVLGLGFMMGPGALVSYARTNAGVTMSLAKAKEIVGNYRSNSKKTVAVWDTLNTAMRKTMIQRRGEDLEIKLPSGRHIRYFGVHEDQGMRASKVKGESPLWWHGGILTENCLAGNSEVLTESGWMRIDLVSNERVWDGMEWVSHDGLISQGIQRTIECLGLRCTPDHLVLSLNGWVTAEQVCGQPDGIQLVCPDEPITSADRSKVWEHRGCGSSEVATWEEHVEREVRLRSNSSESCVRVEPETKPLLWEELPDPSEATKQAEKNAWDESASGLRRVEIHAGTMLEPKTQGLQELRGPWDNRVQILGVVVPKFLGFDGSHVQVRLRPGSNRQQLRVLPEQLSVDYASGELPKQTSGHLRSVRVSDRLPRPVCSEGPQPDHRVLSHQSRVDVGSDNIHSSQFEEPTYDLRNCGPRHRFVARGGPDHPALIVHNCVQGTARDILSHAVVKLEEAGIPVVLHVHDEVLCEVPEEHAEEACQTVKRIMECLPDWCAGLPLNADPEIINCYTK